VKEAPSYSEEELALRQFVLLQVGHVAAELGVVHKLEE
jgi:hypothetical protein